VQDIGGKLLLITK